MIGYPSKQKYNRSFENKNINLNFKLQGAFSFKFAANCQVFISESRKRFNVCRIGYNNVNGIIMFNHEAISRVGFDSLYKAIQYFIYEVNLICSDLDWYKPTLFNPDEFYEFANKRLYK